MKSHRAALLLLSIGLVIGGLPTEAMAQRFIPQDRGLPGRREGGGSRGSCISSQPSLTALMPSQNSGLTVSTHPSFFWYVPANSAAAAEFVLTDDQDTELYKTTFQVTGKPGVISLELPTQANIPALELGKNYHWYFSLVCDVEDRSGDIYTEGWIQRTELTSDLAKQLASANEGDRPNLYAQAVIWYDALASMADLYRAQPSLAPRWRTLLESVELGHLANQPLVSNRPAIAATHSEPSVSVAQPILVPAPQQHASPSHFR